MTLANTSGIVKPLPEALTRHVSAAVDVSNPVAVVKELLENAYDAKAKSIAVEIAADTLEVIQVRDDGTGIAPEDRRLVARRHCTSKIREFDDLRRVGGSTLGFRGVALSSIAAMSGALQITTRTETEGVAARLHIDAAGEVTKSTEPTSKTCHNANNETGKSTRLLVLGQRCASHLISNNYLFERKSPGKRHPRYSQTLDA